MVHSRLHPQIERLLAQADVVTGNPDDLDDRGSSHPVLRHQAPDELTFAMVVSVLLEVLRWQQVVEHSRRDATDFWHSAALAYEAVCVGDASVARQ